jgi:hypothetical protein
VQVQQQQRQVQPAKGSSSISRAAASAAATVDSQCYSDALNGEAAAGYRSSSSLQDMYQLLFSTMYSYW